MEPECSLVCAQNVTGHHADTFKSGVAPQTLFVYNLM
jgi:hypothetical protein